MTDDELKALIASLAVAQKEAIEQMRRTDEKLEGIGAQLRYITQSQVDVAKEFFFQSLIKENRLGAIRFDDVVKNMEKYRDDVQEHYDLFMTSNDAVAIVEVRYKAQESDLAVLDRKLRHLKQLFPNYQQHKLYGAIAAFYINDAAKKEALRRGYYVLQRTGDLVHSEVGYFHS